MYTSRMCVERSTVVSDDRKARRNVDRRDAVIGDTFRLHLRKRVGTRAYRYGRASVVRILKKRRSIDRSKYLEIVEAGIGTAWKAGHCNSDIPGGIVKNRFEPDRYSARSKPALRRRFSLP
jgi:hypothetical protein